MQTRYEAVVARRPEDNEEGGLLDKERLIWLLTRAPEHPQLQVTDNTGGDDRKTAEIFPPCH